MKIEKGAGWIRNIVVNTHVRRRGLGTLLLEHAINIFRSYYYDSVYLYVRKDNMPAVSLYIKEGFKEYGSGKNVFYMKKQI